MPTSGVIDLEQSLLLSEYKVLVFEKRERESHAFNLAGESTEIMDRDSFQRKVRTKSRISSLVSFTVQTSLP